MSGWKPSWRPAAPRSNGWRPSEIMAEPKPLKLRVKDADDLAVISALLQDALVPLKDIAYRPKEKRLVMIASRFCWECPSEGASPALAEAEHEPAPQIPFKRINCGLVIDRVKRAQTRDINLTKKERFLNLLAVDYQAPHLLLAFSGGAEVRLEVEGLALHLEDIGSPWPTDALPSHLLDEEGASR